MLLPALKRVGIRTMLMRQQGQKTRYPREIPTGVKGVSGNCLGLGRVRPESGRMDSNIASSGRGELARFLVVASGMLPR
jgi:hypothetical protein